MNQDTDLSGRLEFLNLGEILQLIGSNNSSGILRITSKYAPGPGLIYIVDGNPVNASNASLTGLDALKSLFGWVEGEFGFTQEQVDSEKVIKRGRMDIILDALSMLDEGAIEKLGPETIEKKILDSTDVASTLPVIRGPLVDYIYVVDEEEHHDGKEIVFEGKHGSWIWVILEGVVEIARETPEERLKVLRLGDGSFVGSISSFLMEGHVRNATAVAIGDVQLGVLDSRRLATEFARMSAETRGLIISLDKRLRQVTDNALNVRLKMDESEDLVKGKKLVIKQGEGEDKIFKITQGEAYVVRHTDKGNVLLACLEKEDFFGKIPFVDMGNEPYSASVFGSEDLEVSDLDPENLKKEHDKLSSTFKNIIENIATCISATTMVACAFHKKTGKNKPQKS